MNYRKVIKGARLYQTPPLDKEYIALTAAIVEQAVKDLAVIRKDGDGAIKGVTETELYTFFNSDWFDTLLTPHRIDPNVARAKLEIPKNGTWNTNKTSTKKRKYYHQ